MPDHVASHYLSLSVRELMEDVLHHYKVNVWPQVEAIIAAASTDTPKERVILEGSALWPEFAAALDVADLAAVWLTASDSVFEKRIHAASQYRTKSRRARTMVDKFLARTLLYNAQMMDAIRQHRLVSMDVDSAQRGGADTEVPGNDRPGARAGVSMTGWNRLSLKRLCAVDNTDGFPYR